jgi:GT2 family glycosyltransferase
MALRDMISAIVVNYNGAKYLSACLRSLCEQTYKNLEVIVVDNASTDGSDVIPAEYAASVRLIRTGQNLGYAGGLNQGIAMSAGDAIFTLNNDIVLHSSCVMHLAQAMETDPVIGMCTPKMLLPDGRLNSTGLCISRSGAAWNRDMGKEDLKTEAEKGEILGPCGGAALYRKAMLEQIGSFDEYFFMYMEDVDMATRARLAGWGCRYVPKAVVVHANGATAGRGSDFAVYYGNRNVLWYPFKNFPLSLLVTSLPWIFGRNLALILYYTLQGRGKLIFRAKMHAIAGLGEVIRKRREIIRSRPAYEFSRFVQTWSGGEASHVGP